MTGVRMTSVVGALFLAFTFSPRGAAAIPIHFAPPSYRQGIGRGYLQNIHSRSMFTFRAHAGQHVRVNIVGYGSTRGVVLFPHSGQDGGPGGVVFDETVHQTGLYSIRVTEDTMADAWHGRVAVYVTRR
jgi:hypothetical protein